MKSKQAWEAEDGQVFFDKDKAEKHEEQLRRVGAQQQLAKLFQKFDSNVSQQLAAYVINNAREFATAISPLVTKSMPGVPRTPVQRYAHKTTFCNHHERVHVVDGSSGHWECASCGLDTP